MKNHENFVQQSSHQHLTNHRLPAVAIHAEASNNAVVGVRHDVCACQLQIHDMQNSMASAIRNGDEGHPMVKRRKEEYGEKSRDQMCLPLELDQQN